MTTLDSHVVPLPAVCWNVQARSPVGILQIPEGRM